MAYYMNYIKGRDDWEFVGMYSDEGISATNTKHRDGFNQMIADALDGKIDLIVTKSVSRFARNTVDSLQTVRKLKEKGIEIYFEKENKGEIPKYYVEEHHEAIIPPEQFDYIQAEIARRKNESRYRGITIFSNKIKCGHCGAWYVPKIWHSNDKYRKKIYICNDKYKVKGKPCKSPHFTEDEIKDMFIRALNNLTKVKKTVSKEMNSLIYYICSNI